MDAILSELSSRHQNTDVRFLTAVRPMVERILDDGTPEAARVPLLEMLAETFERDVCMRRDLAIVREGFAAFFEDLKRRLGGR
ncbi:MAG: hypothetical protein KDC98_16230 [Planctomycetes bacterium]|nr:hypothetical protein [Planctomycetota bacterium]